MTKTTAPEADHGSPTYGAFRDPRDLKPNGNNARGKVDETSPEFAQLVASVKEMGVLSPIIIRLRPAGEIIAGHRRHRAALKARLTKVPVIVWKGDEAAAAEVAIVENYCRTDLTPLQHAEAVGHLLERGRTQEQAADLLGVALSAIARWARLRTLSPKWRAAIKADKQDLAGLSASALVTVAALEPAAQDELLEEFKDYREHIPESTLVRKAEMWLRELAKAPFNVYAVGLNGNAPSCAACPKRAAAVPNLFDDIGPQFRDSKLPKNDRCLDATCWHAKHASAIKTACVTAAMIAGCEGDDGPVLILGRAIDDETAIKAGGKLVSRTEQPYTVGGRVKPMKKGDKRPDNAEAAVSAETAQPVWLLKRPASGNTSVKEHERTVPQKLTIKERMAGLADRRIKHVLSAFVGQLQEHKRRPKDPVTAVQLMVAFGCDGTCHPVNHSPNEEWMASDDGPWGSVKEKICDMVGSSKSDPAMQGLGTWAIEQTTGTPLKQLIEQAAIAIPEPKSWAKDK